MISIDSAELRKFSELVDQADLNTVLKAVEAVRSASYAVERRVKQEMPVDTGRARASWGHWDGGGVSNPDASTADARWEEDDGGLSITQGSNVNYIIYLEAGHSRQAPAGFIERAGLSGQLALEKFLGLIDPLSAEGVSRYAASLPNY